MNNWDPPIFASAFGHNLTFQLAPIKTYTDWHFVLLFTLYLCRKKVKFSPQKIFENSFKINDQNMQQAGAELGQAQRQLGLRSI